MNIQKRMGLILTIGLLGISFPAGATPQSAQPVRNDAGIQLRRDRENLERQQIAQQIEENRSHQGNAIDDKRGTANTDKAPAISFQLKEILLDSSAILSASEWESIKKDYIGKAVTVQDLYALVGRLNKLYMDKGYVTCRAFLEPQRIENGVVHIRLVEGRTGEIVLTGNNHTDKDYIEHRLSLKSGEIANIHRLNGELLRFNAANDAQLHITLEAGKKSGTTDYVITVAEPENIVRTIYADTAGSRSTGRWRTGMFFLDRSVSGRRDSLLMSTLLSKGNKSFSTQYTMPVGPDGARLRLDYSTNGIKVVDGPGESFDTRGHSNYMGASFIQPLSTTEHTRTEASFGVNYQNSQTEFRDLNLEWTNDTIQGYDAAFSMTRYGNASVTYQKHLYRFGNANSQHFGKYVFNGLYQKAYGQGKLLSLRLDGQLSGTDGLISEEQFFLGGAYSVRGYEENLLSGDNGICASLEFAVPVNDAQNVSLFTFLDYGSVTGDSALSDHVLASTGLGIRGSFSGGLNASLTLGIPLIRGLNGDEVSKERLHFSISSAF